MKRFFPILAGVLLLAAGCSSAPKLSPTLPENYEIRLAVTDFYEQSRTYEAVISENDGFIFCYADDPELSAAFRKREDGYFESYRYENGKYLNTYTEFLEQNREAIEKGDISEEAIRENILTEKAKAEIMRQDYLRMLTCFSGCAGHLKKVGTDTVAGRPCTVYRLKREDMGNLKNLFFDALYTIDDEYHLCLKYEIEGDTDRGKNFVCTSFITENVEISALS